MEHNLFGHIKEDKETWEKTTLNANPTYASTAPEVIELIELYSNSKYKNDEYDDSGWKKPFLNIVDNPVGVAAKMTDIDTKNVLVLAEPGYPSSYAHITERELKQWMKEKLFGLFMNICLWERAKYGHVVVKKQGVLTKGKQRTVPLGNIMTHPEAEWLEESPFVIEKHRHSIFGFQKLSYPEDKKKEVIDNYKKAKKTEIEVYERFGEVEGETDNYFIIAGWDINKPVILYQDYLKELPYKETKFEHVAGRWLGKGIVEKLFENQIAKNEQVYYFQKGLKWTSLHAWQTRDENIARNFLTDIDDGDIITAISEIVPISTEERNLGAFRYADALWDSNTQNRTFSQDIIRGERPPAGTPLGTSQLQAAMSGGWFDLKREDVGFFFKEIIWEWLIPEFKKQSNKEHKVKFASLLGENAEELMEAATADRFNKTLPRMIGKGYFPSMQEMDVMKATIKRGLQDNDFKFPEKFYDDFEFKIDVVITNEQIDLQNKVTAGITALQMLNNPTILENPQTADLFYQITDWMGIPLKKKPTMNLDEAVARARQGGSISLPTANASPQMATKTQAL